MAENRLIMLLRDFISERPSEYEVARRTFAEAFGKMIETYITTREQLKLVIQLVDLRHPPTEDDVLMYDFLKYYDIPTLIIATKEDKIPKGKVQKHIKIIKEKLELEKGDQIISYSSIEKKKQDLIWSTIQEFLEA